MPPARVAAVRSVPPVVAVLGVYAALFAIWQSAWFARGPTLISAAIAIDLTITAPVLVWWLGVRRAGWPTWTVAATFAAGLFAGRTALPGGGVVSVLIAAWLAAECVIAVLAISRIRTVVRVARAHRGPGPISAVEAGLIAARVPARVAGLIATDLVGLWLGITGWFRRAPRTPDAFAMHRRKSWTAIVLILLGLIAVETIAIHLLVVGWNPIVAWVLTALSIYSAIWFSADLHAIRLYPLRVTADDIVVAIGLRWRFTIPRADITSVALADAVPDGALDASVLEPTVVVTLARPIEARSLFGIRRTRDVIALTVDEPERLIETLAAQ